MKLEMVAYAREAAVKSFSGNEEIIVLPRAYRNKPVTKIITGAFKNNTTVKYVIVPDTVAVIQDDAFENCPRLRGITSSVEMYEYSDLVSMEQDELKRLLEKEFRSNLPQLREIGARAFKNTAIQAVELPASGLIEIGEEAFEGSEIEVFLAANSDEVKFSKRVFADANKLFICLLPHAHVKSVPSECFLNCNSLRSYGSKRLQNIGISAFRGCTSLKSVDKIPKSGIETGERAFEGCDQLDLSAVGLKKEKPPKPKKSDEEETKAARMQLKKQVEEVRKEMKLVEFDFPLFTLESDEEYLEGTQLLTGRFMSLMDEPDLEDDSEADVYFVSNGNKGEYLCEGLCLPLLKYLAKKGLGGVMIRVRGRECFGIFAMKMNANLIKVLVNRLYGRVEGLKNTEVVFSPEELKVMEEVLWQVLPDWVRSAVRKERKAIEASADDSDGRKHGMSALRYLLNIEFREQPLTALPSVQEAREALDAELYALEKVKKQLLTTLATMRRTGKPQKAGLLLVGPPGTGKTSIARAFAKICNLGEIVNLDMTTIGKDPEAVSGSSRIYHNAKTGLLADSLLNLRSASRGVLLVNEMDQVYTGSSDRSIMAEVIRSVVDRSGGMFENYLEVLLPIGYFVIGTANSSMELSPALLDRFEVIEISPFSPAEKVTILKNYVLPKMLVVKSLREQVTITEDAVDLLVGSYLLEEGARDIEKAVEKILGEVILLEEEYPGNKYLYDRYAIERLFGPPPIMNNLFSRTPGTVEFLYLGKNGASAGLLEVTARPGSGQVSVLGLGENQADYVKVACEAVRSFVPKLGEIDMTFFSSARVPDDGPNQVGLAAFLAVFSLLTGKELPLSESLVFGGVDLHGAIYTVDPRGFLREAARRGRSLVLAPAGTSPLVESDYCRELNVIEALDAKTLFEMAIQVKNAGTP